jgi:RNA recognition motif. (a.k.a. RRM, RBD, or RNP domain)
MTSFSPGGFEMSTHIHVSGLSYFSTDDKFRQAFTPFGTVLFAQILRDEFGHSLGLGVVHMASSEDVERVFNAPQLFQVSGSRVDLWEAAEPKYPQDKRIVVFDLRDTRAVKMGQDTGHDKSRTAVHPWVMLMRRLIQTLVPSALTVER